MELNLKGKTVAITGGSSGIGKETAHEYLKEGCNVAICARGEERLEATRLEFLAEGHEIVAGVVDVTDHEALASFADEIVQKYGKIDIWYNNAGFNPGKALMDYDIDEFREVVDKLLVSDFSGCKIAATHMRKSGGGVILNASSFSAHIPMAGRGIYGACKAGVKTLTQVFAAELACDNIRVLSYAPGLIVTELTKDAVAARSELLKKDIPTRRFGTVGEVAKLLVVLSSDVGSYVNGTHIDITGGKLCVQNPQYAWEMKEQAGRT
jgi:3-oxoacyl-[acyl-carrier protein] reductase